MSGIEKMLARRASDGGFLDDFRAKAKIQDKIEEGVDTSPDSLAARREELEVRRIYVEAITEGFRDPNSKITEEERQRLFLSATLVSYTSIQLGLGIIADCLGRREPCLIENEDGSEEEGFIHTTVADNICPNDPSVESGDEEPNVGLIIKAIIAEHGAGIFGILHDLGVRLDPGIFEYRDKNNVLLARDKWALTPEEAKKIETSQRRKAPADKAVSKKKIEQMRRPLTLDEIRRRELGKESDDASAGS